MTEKRELLRLLCRNEKIFYQKMCGRFLRFPKMAAHVHARAKRSYSLYFRVNRFNLMNMAFPKSAKDTGQDVLDMRIYTDEIIPNCKRCFVIAGTHIETKERGWYAFCKKSGKLEKVGPYETFHKALKTLALTQGCDSCEFNKYEDKASFLSLLDKKIKEEMIEIFGEDHILSVVMGPLQFFVENRNYLDINFEARFGKRLFKSVPDDPVAVVNLIKPCQNAVDFANKVQALTGMIDRINENEIRKLIKDKKKQQIQGSINILEQILKENIPNYPRHIISNLRNLMKLRNKMYPTHATSSEILVVLRNFGINKYPLDDWEKGWRKILGICSNSLGDFVKALQK